jgi:hypothetical protein
VITGQREMLLRMRAGAKEARRRNFYNDLACWHGHEGAATLRLHFATRSDNAIH